MGSLVQQHSTTGTAANSRTETFSACVAGNLMLLAAGVSENTGTNTINAPTGGLWTLLHTFRQGTTTVRVAVYGKVSTGGETSQVITSSSAQRFQTWFGEFNGYGLSSPGTANNGNSSSVASGNTGTLGVASTRLAFSLMLCKNAVTGLVNSSGFTAGVVNNEGGAVSTQKVTMGIGWDLTPAVSVTPTWTWGATVAQYGGMTISLPAAGTAYTQGVSGALSFSGAAPKKASTRRVTGAVSFAGTRTAAPTARLTTGSFAPSGALAQQQSLLRSLAGVLSWSGALSRSSSRSLAGSLSFAGTRSSIKSVSQAVSGALSFSGAVSRFPMKLLAASLTPSGVLAAMQSLLRTVTGSFTPHGVVNKQTNRKVTGSASFSGVVGGLLPTTRFFASITPHGAVTNGLPARTLYAAFSATGTLAKFTARRLFASLVAGGVMNTQYIPPVGPTPPGGGGFGALMDEGFFQRYEVAAKWRHMKRVRVK